MRPSAPMRIACTALLSVLLAGSVAAQPANSDCSTAALLCAQQALSGNNTGATGWPGFCAGTANVVWYTFTTNSVGGVAEVHVTGIDCPEVAGMGDELSVVVLAGDGSCTPASFTAVSPCEQDAESITLVSSALLPSTRYWVVVAGAANDGATINAQCDFQIHVGGPGVDVVGVDFSAGPDVTIGQGESTQLHATGGNGYTWSPTNGLSGANVPDPIASPSGTTIYSVTTTVGDCVFTDDVMVQVIRRIDPPNTFTPNGDGINDTWVIPGIGSYPGAQVVIHDRWGQIVYKSTGYREPWDGTHNGARLADGTYYYSIQLNQLEGDAAPYQGFISIVR